MEALQKVATTTGGEFALALNRQDLVQVYDRLDQLETRKVNTVSSRPRRDIYYWPLAVALVLSLLNHWFLLPSRTTESQSLPVRVRVNRNDFSLELSG